MKASHTLMAILAGGFGVLARPVAAGDTIETWDEGAVDFELYTGAGGLGLGRNETSIFADVVLGYGILDRLAGYLRGSGAATEQLGDGSGEAGVGVFGTPIDSNHFDLDLIADFGFGSDGLAITPALEINLDAEPDLAFWGVYLRGQQSFVGREDPAVEPAADAQLEAREPERMIAPVTTVTLGLYWTAARAHQLVVEADGSIFNNPAEGQDAVDFGGVSAGYNVAIHESVELIHHLFIDVPVRTGERLAACLGIGLIATILPGDTPARGATTPMASGRSKRLSSLRAAR
jgi:hypothetical protein